jgi:hemoglobin
VRDIQDRSDLKLIVENFYEKARIDELLGGVFVAAVEDDHWPAHFERVTDFWNSALFDAQSYRGSTFAQHANLPVEKKHFERWLSLFAQTVREHFAGPIAEDALHRATVMGTLFESKISYLRANPEMKNIL